jgi:hypothetical protein
MSVITREVGALLSYFLSVDSRREKQSSSPQ